MAIKDLTAFENRLYHFIIDNDFETRPWNTLKAARELGSSEEEVYKALSELTKKVKDNIWIFYRDGSLHVVAE
jgi:prolyl-tRNA editing enzyme YbaK/EbsC (Cys-tRNA(Pro) deacylase)